MAPSGRAPADAPAQALSLAGALAELNLRRSRAGAPTAAPRLERAALVHGAAEPGPGSRPGPDATGRSAQAPDAPLAAGNGAMATPAEAASPSGAGENGAPSSLQGAVSAVADAPAAGHELSASVRTEATPAPAPDATSRTLPPVIRTAHALVLTTLENGAREARLNLHPPELGALRLTITERDGAVRLSFEVSTIAVREVLMSNHNQLIGLLKDQGFDVTSFNVDVNTGDAGQGAPSGTPGRPDAPIGSDITDAGRQGADASVPDRIDRTSRMSRLDVIA